MRRRSRKARAIGASDESVPHASSNHLSGIIDIMSNSCESIRKASQVGHARTIGAGDESVPIFLDSVPCHLASVIDASGITGIFSQSPQVCYALAVRPGNESVVLTCGCL